MQGNATSPSTNTNKETELDFIKINLHKAKQGQIEVAKQIRCLNKKQKAFVCLVQEPMTDKNRAIFQPNTCQIFSKGSNPRASVAWDD